MGSVPSKTTRASRPPQMCPNQECAKYREETTLLGGCDECGSGLVTWAPPEPTNEHLENFCMVIGVPVWPGWFDRNEQMRQGALNLHRLFQKAATGDAEASAALARWLDLFKGVRDAA